MLPLPRLPRTARRRPPDPRTILKLIAAALAAAIACGCAAPHETDVYLPLELRQVPRGRVISELSNEGIEVRVRGSRAAVEGFVESRPTYGLDLSAAAAERRVVAVLPRDIPVPDGVEIIAVNPSRIVVTIENKVRKTLPVVLAFVGKPAAGHRIAESVTRPVTVELEGPESVMGTVEVARSKPVDVSARSESFRIETALDLPAAITVASPTAMVTGEIRIEEEVVEKVFHQIPLAGRGSGSRFDINPPVLSLTVRGPAGAVAELDREQSWEVYVDLTGLEPGVYVRRATIVLPVSTTLVDARPDLFTVTIKKGG